MPASMSLNFATAAYTRNGIIAPDWATFLSSSGSTFSRASTKYGTTASGLLTNFLSGVAAITTAGLSYEKTATNLVLNSASNTGWANLGAAPGTSAVTFLDGSSTFLTATAVAGAGFHYSDSAAATISNGSVYTYSSYVRRNNNDWTFETSETDSSLSYFNTSTGLFGTVASGVTAAAVALASGCYRISFTKTAAGTTGLLGHGLANANNGANYTAAGTEQVYRQFAQIELGSSASSPIVTTTTSATRAADLLTLNVPSGLTSVLITFDDNSTQTLASSGAAWALPTAPTLNRPTIKSMVWS